MYRQMAEEFEEFVEEFEVLLMGEGVGNGEGVGLGVWEASRPLDGPAGLAWTPEWAKGSIIRIIPLHAMRQRPPRHPIQATASGARTLLSQQQNHQ